MGVPVVFYDGVCGLCAGVVKFIIARDPSKLFRFCSLQSQAAAPFLASQGLTLQEALQSFLVQTDTGAVLRKSDAAIYIGQRLVSPWPYLAAAASLVPRCVRDSAYDLVARNRYSVFGRVPLQEGEQGSGGERCLVPTKAVKARFIELEPSGVEKKNL